MAPGADMPACVVPEKRFSGETRNPKTATFGGLPLVTLQTFARAITGADVDAGFRRNAFRQGLSAHCQQTNEKVTCGLHYATPFVADRDLVPLNPKLSPT
jgi:hypothetical protein